MFGASLSLALIGGSSRRSCRRHRDACRDADLYGILLPVYTIGKFGAGESNADVISTVFAKDVRMIGAGAMAVAAVWTLLKIMRPIMRGISASIASARGRRDGQLVDVTERDIPFPIVSTTSAVLMIPIAILLWQFAHGSVLSGSSAGVIVVSVMFIAIIGFIAAAICGYMAGLVGRRTVPCRALGSSWSSSPRFPSRPRSVLPTTPRRWH